LFPNLIHDLAHSAPIGDLPPLTYTFIPNNIASANIDPDYMDSFIVEEFALGSMDVLFSIASVHLIFKGCFRTALPCFVEKPRTSVLLLIQHHSKEDNLSFATNAWIDSSAGVTKFYSTAHASDFVSKYALIVLTPTTTYICHMLLHISHLKFILLFQSMLLRLRFIPCLHATSQPGDRC